MEDVTQYNATPLTTSGCLELRNAGRAMLLFLSWWCCPVRSNQFKTQDPRIKALTFRSPLLHPGGPPTKARLLCRAPHPAISEAVTRGTPAPWIHKSSPAPALTLLLPPALRPSS